MNTCLRCGYEWESRVPDRPKNCPGCKTPLWDKPRVSLRKAEKAHGKVSQAKKNGTLIPQPCIICGTMDRIQGHHEDYDDPLNVTWYCPIHHKERHKQMGDTMIDTKDTEGGSAFITMRISEEIMAAVDAEVAKQNSNRSAVVKAALHRAFDREDALARQATPEILPPSRSADLHIPGVRMGRDVFQSGEAADPVVDLCGYRSYNDQDGEYYRCGKPAGHGIKHGEWVKE